MKAGAVVVAAFAVCVVLAGCESVGQIADSANTRCGAHGGVENITPRAKLVVCKDGTVVPR